MLAGVYLAEFGHSRFGKWVRFSADVMSGVPSITVGIFVYSLVVLQTKHFSAFAGGVALAVLMLPTVTRTTEELLRLVPESLREAALGLGLPKWRVTLRVMLRTAAPGIATGVMLAVARVAGETAPLLFTAFSNPFWSSGLNEPTASLPVNIYNYAVSPVRGVASPSMGRGVGAAAHGVAAQCLRAPIGAEPGGCTMSVGSQGMISRPASRKGARGEGSSGDDKSRWDEVSVSTLVPKMRTDDLHAYFGQAEVLKGISLQIAEKQVTAVIGPSGCGKSTFVRCLNRMHEVVPGARATGQVLLDKQDIYQGDVDAVRVRRRVGMVFQKTEPVPHHVDPRQRAGRTTAERRAPR